MTNFYIYNLRSPDTCRLENILTSPLLSLTSSISLTYRFRVGTSHDLNTFLQFKHISSSVLKLSRKY